MEPDGWKVRDQKRFTLTRKGAGVSLGNSVHDFEIVINSAYDDKFKEFSELAYLGYQEAMPGEGGSQFLIHLSIICLFFSLFLSRFTTYKLTLSPVVILLLSWG